MSTSRDLGNGDRCPVNPEHGNMFVLKSGTQFCAHSDHVEHKVKGVVVRPATRSIWPGEGFDAAVRAWKESH